MPIEGLSITLNSLCPANNQTYHKKKKSRLFFLMVFLAILAPQACAQRRVVSDYNYQKAVDAFF